MVFITDKAINIPDIIENEIWGRNEDFLKSIFQKSLYEELIDTELQRKHNQIYYNEMNFDKEKWDRLCVTFTLGRNTISP